MADHQSTCDSRASSSGSPPTATPETYSGEQEEDKDTNHNDYLSFLQQSGSAMSNILALTMGQPSEPMGIMPHRLALGPKWTSSPLL